MELVYKSICTAVEVFDRSEYTVTVSENALTVQSAADPTFTYTVSFQGRRLTIDGRTVETQYVTNVSFLRSENKTFQITITYLLSDDATKSVTYVKAMHACTVQ